MDAETLRKILTRGTVVAAPKLTAFAEAKAAIVHQTNTKVLTGFKEGGPADPKPSETHSESDTITLHLPEGGVVKATEATLKTHSTPSKPSRSLDFQDIPEGLHAQFSGHRTDDGVLVNGVIEESRIVGLVNNGVLETVAVGDRILKGRIEVQVPEMIQSRFEGEWLVPGDGALIVGMGIHRIPDQFGQTIIRERLVALKASDFASISPPKSPALKTP